MAVTGRVESVTYLIILIAGSALAFNPVRLDSTVVPFHYDVELRVNVQTKRFTGEESIDLLLIEDSTEIRINNNRLDYGALRLENKETGKVFVPHQSYSMFDDYSEVLYIQFAEVVPGATNYTLHISEIGGRFGAGLEENYIGVNGYVLTTGANVTNLRALIPCFDQPEFKTTFRFSIYHTQGYTLVTNTREIIITGPINTVNNFMLSQFTIDTPLSTASVALLLTNLPVESSTNGRVQVYHSNSQSRAILLEMYEKWLVAVETELNIPNLIPKLDVVFAPESVTTTLSKWGVIYVGNEIWPQNIATYSVDLKLCQLEVLRSIYQMIFGEILMPNWWNSRWINRGLASYFTATSPLLPFDGEKELLLESVQRVIKEDRGIYSALTEPLSTSRSINRPNLLVVQHKAYAVTRMIANIMTEEKFRESVLSFLAANQLTVVTAAQFLEHLSGNTPIENLPQGMTLADVVSGYETQSFRPGPSAVLVQVYEDTFQISRTTDLFPVEMPVDYATTSLAPLNRPRQWILPLKGVDDIKVASNNDLWIVVNPDQMGLYRVQYENELWTKLTQQLKTDHLVIGNRGQLIADSTSLVIDWELQWGQHFELMQYLANETDTWTWRVARKSFDEASFYLRGIEETPRLEKFYAEVAENAYKLSRVEENFVDFERTMQVGWMACLSGSEECISDVEGYVNKTVAPNTILSGSKDFQYLVYCTWAKYLPEKDALFSELLFSLPRGIDWEVIAVPLSGLGCTRDVVVIRKFLDLTVSNLLSSFGINLSHADRVLIIRSFLHGGYEATTETLKFILEYFVQLDGRLDRMDDLFRGLGKYVRTKEQVDLLKEIETEHQVRMSNTVKNLLSAQLSEGSSNSAMLRLVEEGVSKWLQENVYMPGMGNSLKASNLLSLAAVVLVVKRFL